MNFEYINSFQCPMHLFNVITILGLPVWPWLSVFPPVVIVWLTLVCSVDVYALSFWVVLLQQLLSILKQPLIVTPAGALSCLPTPP